MPENVDMEDSNPVEFWDRFKELSNKDLPILLQTGIRQSTLSTWKSGKNYPRADAAVKLAKAVNTTVEYLVTGTDNALDGTPDDAEIFALAKNLSPEGKKYLLAVARGLVPQFPEVKKQG